MGGARALTFPGGAPVAERLVNDEEKAHSYLNIAAVALNEEEGSVTLAISGHRICDDTCPDVTVALVSLQDDAHHRRALPPSTVIELTPDVDIFTQTVQLPCRGSPASTRSTPTPCGWGSRGQSTEDGQVTPLTAELVADQAIITTQDQLRDFDMVQPVGIDPQRVRSGNDPFDFFGVQEQRFDRPVHMKILAALLIALIAVSAIIAVAMRDIRDLIFGIGSLILAIWGVRSVLAPEALSVTTSVDMALSIIILLVLLILTARAAWSFGAAAELPALARRIRAKLR